jgi:hypothetical protein
MSFCEHHHRRGSGLVRPDGLFAVRGISSLKSFVSRTIITLDHIYHNRNTSISIPDMSTFFSPRLCANTERKVDGLVASCRKDALLTCSGCYLVQASGLSPVIFVWNTCNITGDANVYSIALRSVRSKTDRATERHAGRLSYGKPGNLAGPWRVERQLLSERAHLTQLLVH